MLGVDNYSLKTLVVMYKTFNLGNRVRLTIREQNTECSSMVEQSPDTREAKGSSPFFPTNCRISVTVALPSPKR